MAIPSPEIIKKIIVLGEVTNTSPLLIGTGDKSDEIDMIIQRDPDGRPFIPATSFVGALRHHFCRKFRLWGSEEKNCPLSETDKFFWGYSEKKNGVHEGNQSAFIVSDLTLKDKDFSTEIRDGVRIDRKLGIAVDKGKYDYEILPKDSNFDLQMEILIRRGFEGFEDILETLLKELKNARIKIGAMTTKGLGKIQLKGDYRIYEFDFSKPTDVLGWFENKSENWKPSLFENHKAFKQLSKDFTLEAKFSLKTSILIRSYGSKPESPDAVHIQSKGKPVLPGTSLKGALRARGERIAATIGLKDDFIKNLMGFADDEDKDAKKIKSRFFVEESVLDGRFILDQIQSRIKIDRFTGGTMKTALFDLVPVSSKSDEDLIELKIKIEDCSEEEAGLTMLVIKDLWNSDLPLGGEKNVGRGILKGRSAKVDFDGKTYELEQKENRLEKKQGCLTDMDSWVSRLLEKGVK